MVSASVGQVGRARSGHALLACVAEHGSGSHDYPLSEALLRGPHAARNLSDAVHFLCMLHGRQPGVIDHAANRSVEPAARAWFNAAIDQFGVERAILTRLAAAAGPIPSTAGAGDTEAAVISQRHAIEMLAQSERNGCALGAALAVALDWRHVRGVLDAAAARFGIEVPPYALGDPHSIREVADAVALAPPAERAILFGAEQISIQHRGLWDLLEARQQARGPY
jgi:hypothetical protein